MAWNRVNLDGKSNTQVGKAGEELKPGMVVKFAGTTGNFTKSAAGAERLYAVEKSQLSTDINEAIASGDGVNGNKMEPNRVMALLLAASQAVAQDAELFVASGLLTTTGTAGEGVAWANEAVTTGVGENAHISVTIK